LGTVKKARRLFRRSRVACAIIPLHIAPTDAEHANYSTIAAKTFPCGFNVQRCLQGCDCSSAVRAIAAQAGKNTTIDHVALVGGCQATRIVANCSKPFRKVA